MKIPAFVWWLIGIGGAAGVAYFLWSKREVTGTVTVPQDEIVIGPAKATASPKDDAQAFSDLLLSEGLDP